MKKPPIKPMERRVRELVLLDPLTAMMHIYRLDANGMHLLRKLGPVSTVPMNHAVYRQ